MVSGYQAKYTRKELEEKVDSLEAASGDTTEITNIKNTIVGIQGDVDNLKKRVTSLEGTQGNHETRISNLEKAIKDLPEIPTYPEPDPDAPSSGDITNINIEIGKIKTRLTNVEGDVDELKKKMDVLYGPTGIQTPISLSNGKFTLNPNYHYNIITTTAANQVIELASSSGFNNMADGQELYVFVNGQNKFILNVSDATKIVGLGGGIIDTGSTIEPESSLTEISIIKIGSGAYVRLA